MTDKPEKFSLDSKYETRNPRPMKAYVQWKKENPGVKANFYEYIVSDCEAVSDDRCYWTWKCKDKEGSFLVSRYICSSSD